MKRADALNHLRIAGYHGDAARFTRIYVEHRIGISAARAEFDQGKKMKSLGVPCCCIECNKPTAQGASLRGQI